MNLGFSKEEYERVRGWLIAALNIDPHYSEDEVIERFRDGTWQLLTTEHAACALQLCILDGEKVAIVQLIGGEKNKALTEIGIGFGVVCEWLRLEGFTKITGRPRKGLGALLLRLGFQKGSKEQLFMEL